MRIIKILLIVAILIYAAAMGYLWNETRRSANKIVQSAAPFANISYDSIYISPLGNEIGLDHIVIAPRATQDLFAIEKLRFTAPHMGYFVNAKKSFQRGKPPENLGMSVKGIQLDLNSELFTAIDQQQQYAKATATEEDKFTDFLSSLETLGCGDKASFTLNDYRRMGIGKIVADAGASFKFIKRQNKGQFNGKINAPGLYAIDFTVDFNAIPEAGMTTFATETIPRITIKYHDEGYHKLRNAYCADINNSTAKAFVDHHTQLLSNRLGAVFPEPTVKAYKSYMLNGGNFSVKLNPDDVQSLDSLQYYKPADVIQMLGMDVSINGTQVDKKAIQWKDKDHNTVATNPTSRSTSVKPRPQSVSRSGSGSRPAATFHLIRTSEAGKYLKHTVEITTSDGKVRKGILDKVSNTHLYLTIKVSSASLRYPVDKLSINKLRVLK